MDKEGNDKPLSKTQKKKIVESYELSEGEKDYYLDTNPNGFTIEELERLVDCGIFTSRRSGSQSRCFLNGTRRCGASAWHEPTGKGYGAWTRKPL